MWHVSAYAAMTPSHICFCRTEPTVREWLFKEDSSWQIDIKPRQPPRNAGHAFAQGEIYDCYVGRLNPVHKLRMSGVWVWVRERYSHCASLFEHKHLFSRLLLGARAMLQKSACILHQCLQSLVKTEFCCTERCWLKTSAQSVLHDQSPIPL